MPTICCTRRYLHAFRTPTQQLTRALPRPPQRQVHALVRAALPGQTAAARAAVAAAAATASRAAARGETQQLRKTMMGKVCVEWGGGGGGVTPAATACRRHRVPTTAFPYTSP